MSAERSPSEGKKSRRPALLLAATIVALLHVQRVATTRPLVPRPQGLLSDAAFDPEAHNTVDVAEGTLEGLRTLQ